jgi:P27 family predicted phage terminase small subunit
VSRPKADPQGHAARKPHEVALLPALPTPEPPATLGAVGVKVWRSVWAAGGAAYHGLTDSFTIERYCSLQERRFRFLDVLDAEGWTTVGSQGQVVPHPMARLLTETEKMLTGLEDRLGLSPEARLRLGLAAQALRDDLDDFLSEDE